MSEETKEALTQVKVEPDDEVEPYDGSYACGFCSESCGARGKGKEPASAEAGAEAGR